MEHLLGPGYTFDKTSRTYRAQNSYSFSVKTGLKKDPNNPDSYLKTIGEIFISGDYLKNIPANGEIIPGIKAGIQYEKCEEKLNENNAVAQVTPGSDLNGKFIKFNYKHPTSGEQYHLNFRFSPTKSKYKLVSFYVKK